MGKSLIATLTGVLALSLGGCAVEVVGTGIAGNKQATVRASNVESVVDETGRCEADVRIDPAALRSNRPSGLVGRTECDVVAIKGRPAEVVIRDGGPIRRTTMLYDDRDGPVDYLFENNRLARITRHAR
ncbi:MAG: hypothetical protein K2P80_08635 [Beijerinckiaceae bacterium]|nr:hypothetical protein [Beijerinckiaceae bacterium]